MKKLGKLTVIEKDNRINVYTEEEMQKRKERSIKIAFIRDLIIWISFGAAIGFIVSYVILKNL